MIVRYAGALVGARQGTRVRRNNNGLAVLTRGLVRRARDGVVQDVLSLFAVVEWTRIC